MRDPKKARGTCGPPQRRSWNAHRLTSYKSDEGIDLGDLEKGMCLAQQGLTRLDRGRSVIVSSAPPPFRRIRLGVQDAALSRR
jgi:hypothetical protein